MGLIGGVKKGGGFAGAGVAFQNADDVASAREFGLLRGPGRGTVVFAADFGDGDGEIIVGEVVGVEGCVVVVVADVAEEEGAGGDVFKSFDGDGALRCPPRVKMRTGGAAEAGPPPAFVVALSTLVVEAFGVDQQALEKEGGAFSVLI